MIKTFFSALVVGIAVAVAGCTAHDDAPMPADMPRLPVGGDILTSTKPPTSAEATPTTRPPTTSPNVPRTNVPGNASVPPVPGDQSHARQEETQTNRPSEKPSPVEPPEELPDSPESPGFTGSWYPYN
jgi:hypothetical protein